MKQRHARLPRDDRQGADVQMCGEDARPFVEAMAEEEDRILLRCRPYEILATPPRHLHHNDQEEKLTHWSSGTVPWNAPDPAPPAQAMTEFVLSCCC